MTARSLGDVLKGVTPKLTRIHQPVRRNSYHRGEREQRLWRPIDRKRIGATLRAAEQFDRTHKQAGKRNGPLGHIGLEVLRQLYRIADYRSGRCEPSIDTLMRALRRSRDAVVKALARLRCHGFLNWIRRTEPTGIEDGSGPRVRQIPNAYWFSLPRAAAAMVARLLRAPPPPADAVCHAEANTAELQAMLASLPLDELPRVIVDDPGLATALAQLGAGVAAQDQSASLPCGHNPSEEV